jgi:hypothetical protein
MTRALVKGLDDDREAERVSAHQRSKVTYSLRINGTGAYIAVST